MNFGTKVRTVARVAVSAYTAFCVWQTVVDGFGNKTASFVWAILIIIFGWLVDFATTWFNNDFTPEACIGTGVTRQRKAEKKADYVGERFYTDGDAEDDEPDFDDEPVFGEVGEAIEQEAEDAQDDI